MPNDDKAAPRALVILAEEGEEMEAVITVDVLRRGGVHVDVAGLDGAAPVRCSRNVVIVPDVALADATGDYDVVVLPGGLGGVKRLAASQRVGDLLRAREREKKLVAAICAAPAALAQHGVFSGRPMTCHPSTREVVSSHGAFSEDRVVVDGDTLITSQGPGSAFEFALALVTHLAGADKAKEIAPPMVLPPTLQPPTFQPVGVA